MYKFKYMHLQRKDIMQRIIGSTIILLTATLALSSCGEMQEPINRVEAYALQKTMFHGEWFYDRTVVDAPASAAIAFKGEKAMSFSDGVEGMVRIRWDIQEKYIYARKAYETIRGSKDVSQDTGEFKGELIGAWRIKTHFDIKRAYSATTGEESNILTENPLDCKWYDCNYLRVDWSKNYATDVNFLYFGWPAVKKDPVPFSDQDASDPRYKPIFDMDAGYIDVTTNQAVAPRDLSFPSWGGVSLPLCYFYQDMACATEIYKVRHSFWKRDPNRDYEPRILRGNKDEWFGYFVTTRWNYSSNYGVVYGKKPHYLMRFNTWDKSHDEKAPCKTDVECKTAGSSCDVNLPFHKFDVATDTDADTLPDAFEDTVEGLDPKVADSDGDGLPDAKDDADGNGVRDIEDFWAWDNKHMEFRCTIPMAQRDPVPVTYFTTGNWPRSFVCDEHKKDDKKDKDTALCKPWVYSGDTKVRQGWSMLHRSSEAWNDGMTKVYLRGAHGFSDAEYKTWIAKHSPAGLSADKQKALAKLGDAKLGYHAFVICPHNPVQKADPWPCRFPRHTLAQAKDLMTKHKLDYNHLSYAKAKELLGKNKTPDQTAPLIRLGDVRYSKVNYLDQYYQQGSYKILGVAQPSPDARTGEIVSSDANLAETVNNSATRQQEKVDLLNGKIKPTDFINGVNLDAWVKAVNSMGLNQTNAKSYTQSNLDDLYQSVNQEWMKGIPKQGASGNFDTMRAQMNNKAIKAKLAATFAKSGILDPARTKLDITAIKGTPLEKKLINNEVLAFAGIAPKGTDIASSAITSAMLDKASIGRSNFWYRLEAVDKYRELLREERLMTLAEDVEMVDTGLVGLAQRVKNLSSNQVWNMFRDKIGGTTVVHEIGHAMGLKHNFGGSEDAVNFSEEYWRLRTSDWTQTEPCNLKNPNKNQLCPFFIKGHEMTNYQMGIDPKNATNNLKGMYEYATTSIMDYNRFGGLTTQYQLGRYDNAALMFGYAGKVEVFKNVGKVPAGFKSESEPNVFEEWWGSQGSVLMLYSNRAQAYHYTNWYPAMKKDLFLESNRQLVDYRDVNDWMKTSGYSKGYYYQKGDTKLVRVPYIFCKRTSSNIGARCLTHDQGVDQYEKMKSMSDNWETWYILSNFPRQQYGASPWKYVNGKFAYFYKRLKDFNNGFAYFQALFHQWYDQASIAAFMSDPLNGYGSFLVAVNDAFNIAIRTMTMPDMSYYGDKMTDVDGQEYYPLSNFQTSILPGLNNSRYFSTEYYDTNYEQTCGYYWRECLHHIGYYMDKMVALIVLSDPRTYFVGQDTSEDVRQYRISFFNNFTDQIIDIMGGILAHEYDKISPYYDPTKPRDKTLTDTAGVKWVNRVAARDFANPTADPTKPTTGAPLQSGTRFTVQIYTAVLGMFRFQNNFDNEFVERGRIWKKGKSTTWNITPTTKIEGVSEFIDPWNGSTYVGIAYKDKRGIAQRMLARANMLKSKTSYCTPAEVPPVVPAPVDLCVSVSTTDANRAEGELLQYKDLLDTLVQITGMYDSYGHNWSWNPYDP